MGKIEAWVKRYMERREETIEPKKIFQAPSAMTEVDWEG